MSQNNTCKKIDSDYESVRGHLDTIPEIRGRFRDHIGINERCSELVRHAIDNDWDRDTVVQWLMVTWIDMKGD